MLFFFDISNTDIAQCSQKLDVILGAKVEVIQKCILQKNGPIEDVIDQPNQKKKYQAIQMEVYRYCLTLTLLIVMTLLKTRLKLTFQEVPKLMLNLEVR